MSLCDDINELYRGIRSGGSLSEGFDYPDVTDRVTYTDGTLKGGKYKGIRVMVSRPDNPKAPRTQTVFRNGKPALIHINGRQAIDPAFSWYHEIAHVEEPGGMSDDPAEAEFVADRHAVRMTGKDREAYKRWLVSRDSSGDSPAHIKARTTLCNNFSKYIESNTSKRPTMAGRLLEEFGAVRRKLAVAYGVDEAGYRKHLRRARALSRTAETDPTIDSTNASQAVMRHKWSTLDAWKRYQANKATNVNNPKARRNVLDNNVLNTSPLGRRKAYTDARQQDGYRDVVRQNNAYKHKRGTDAEFNPSHPSRIYRDTNVYRVSNALQQRGYDRHMAWNGYNGKGVYFNSDPLYKRAYRKRGGFLPQAQGKPAMSLNRPGLEHGLQHGRYESPRALQSDLSHMAGQSVNFRTFQGHVYADPASFSHKSQKLGGFKNFQFAQNHEVGHLTGANAMPADDSPYSRDPRTVFQRKIAGEKNADKYAVKKLGLTKKQYSDHIRKDDDSALGYVSRTAPDLVKPENTGRLRAIALRQNNAHVLARLDLEKDYDTHMANTDFNRHSNTDNGLYDKSGNYTGPYNSNPYNHNQHNADNLDYSVSSPDGRLKRHTNYQNSRWVKQGYLNAKAPNNTPVYDRVYGNLATRPKYRSTDRPKFR